MQEIEKKKTNINYKRLTAILTVYLFMFFYGFAQGCDFVARPMIIKTYPTEFTKYVSYLFPLSMAIGSFIYSYMRIQKSLLISLLIFCLGALTFSMSVNSAAIVCAMIISSLAYGCFETSLNASGFILFHGKTEAKLICWLHFFFAIGEVVSTSCATNISHILEMGYHSIYAILITFAIIMVLVLMFVDFKLPEFEAPASKHTLREAFNDSKVWFFIGAFTLINYIESFILNDVLTYIIDAFLKEEDRERILGFTEWILYFYAGSRLFLGYFVDKIGHFLSIMICMSAVVVLLLITAFCGPFGVYVVIFSGIFIGLIYPTIFTIAMDSFAPHSCVPILVIIVFSNIGSIIGKFLTTLMMQYYGFFTGITLSIIFGVLLIILIYWYSTELFNVHILSNYSNEAVATSGMEPNNASTADSVTAPLVVNSIDQQFVSL